ncbi:hypothetical protein ACFL5G_00005, partial [Candidatus Margulisiibacteriota bacterium]
PTWQSWVVSGDYAFRVNSFHVSANEIDTEYVSQRARLVLGRQGIENGILFELDTGFVNPGVEGLAKNITTNVLAVQAWAETPAFGWSTLRFDATAGPGDLALNDYPSNGYVARTGTIIYRPGNALKCSWELFNVDISARYEKRLKDVDRTTAIIGYTYSLEDFDLGTIHIAGGSDVYSQGGESPTNSPHSIYEIEFKPYDWLTLSARGSRLYTFATEEIEYYTESKMKLVIPQSDTEILAEIDRLSGDFYIDNISDEIIAVNILGYAVLPEFEAAGFGIKQNLLDRKIYLAGYHNIATSMLTDEDLIHLYQELASQFEFGWNITNVASFSLMGRNTHYQLLNDPQMNELVDHILSAQFKISF